MFPLASDWVGVHSTCQFVRLVRLVRTNGITMIPLVFYWWNASHYRDLEYFSWLSLEWGCSLLVHWHDWNHWNNRYSIGIPLVKCISLWGSRIFPLASGWVRVHSTCPLVRLVRERVFWTRTLKERRIYIVFSVCLGSHALRTKNIHSI